MAVNKVQYGNTTLIDLSQDTVASAADIVSGKVGHLRDGSVVTGTASGGGGSSSWTKVAETSYQVSTTDTSVTTVATLETGSSDLWTSAKWVYVRVRDTAGKRVGYFYGTDQFFYNPIPANSGSGTNTATALRISTRYSTSGQFTITTSAYGVYPDTVYKNGRVRIRSRYHSTYSTTINGTYKVEVYLLDPPTGAPIFE